MKKVINTNRKIWYINYSRYTRLYGIYKTNMCMEGKVFAERWRPKYIRSDHRLWASYTQQKQNLWAAFDEKFSKKSKYYLNKIHGIRGLFWIVKTANCDKDKQNNGVKKKLFWVIKCRPYCCCFVWYKILQIWR